MNTGGLGLSLRRLLMVVLLAWALLLCASAAAWASPILVNTTSDAPPSGTECLGAPGDCSVRQALDKVPANGFVSIPANAQHYKVTLGEIPIAKAVTILGGGASSTVIDASTGTGRVFHVTATPASTSSVSIQGVTITGGKATTMPGGGGILVDFVSSSVAVNLVLVNSVVSGNDATVSTGAHTCCGGGGGVYNNGGAVTLTGSSVRNNTTTVTGSTASGTIPACCDGGGGIYDNYSAITLTGSTVNNNTATVTGYYCCHGGGGIYSDGANGNAPIAVSGGSQVSGNSFTLNGNPADIAGQFGNCCSGGGGIYQDNNTDVSVQNSALSGNSATINSGQCCHGGGAVYMDNHSALNISGSTQSHNTATVNGPSGQGSNNHCCSGGGADAVFGPETLTNSTLDSNTSSVAAGDCCHGGGGVQIDSNQALASLASTIINNTSTVGPTATESGGGGVYEDTGAGAKNTYTNSTISGNSTNAANPQFGGGGGLFLLNGSQTGPDTLANATIAGNSASAGAGGGVDLDGGKLSTKNSLIATNTAAAHSDCSKGGSSPAFASLGYNLVSSADNCGFTGAGDKVVSSSSVGLGPLANNGGPTQTRALLLGSPAVDAGNPAGCTDPAGAMLVTDQRGFIRPFGPRCDIGAFELQQSAAGAPKCTLKAKSNKVLVRAPKGRKGKKARKQLGKLTLKVRCDQNARVKLTGKAIEQLRKKGKKHKKGKKTFKLRGVSKNVTAGKAITLTLKLSKKALNALAHGARESVTLTLTASNSHGTSKKTLKIKRLRVRRR